jgi:hypothetical protein
MNEFDGHWIATQNVPEFHYLDPNPNEILIEDIAHALSLQCRFGGHSPYFYSVAEHSVRVSIEAGRRDLSVKDRLAALLHDAEEAYLPDIPRPIKHDMSEAQKIYTRIQKVINKKFGIEDANWVEIKRIDDQMTSTEADRFGLLNPNWSPLGRRINRQMVLGWEPELAEDEFLRRYKDLMEEL